MIQKYCTCQTKRLLTHFETRLDVTKCHACHAKRSYAKQKTPKSDRFCRTRHRHGHSDLTRTVADANATSSEHTLNPQTPRVKREPLLRIQETKEHNMQYVCTCTQNLRILLQLHMPRQASAPCLAFEASAIPSSESD